MPQGTIKAKPTAGKKSVVNRANDRAQKKGRMYFTIERKKAEEQAREWF